MKFIGIVCWTEMRYKITRHELNRSFSDIVANIDGAIPVMFPQINDDCIMDEFIDMVDGIILIGGSDVSPHLYNEGPKRELHQVNPLRDEIEINILKKSIKKNKPILAVCRGMQLLNIYKGGTLYQDIYSDIEDVYNHSDRDGKKVIYYHNIDILDKESHLYKAFKSDDLLVNSFHHQAIKKLGIDLKIVAKSEDGIIEAVEHTKDPMVMGIQFHPEFPEHNRKFYKVFEYFIENI